jgi:hypothetical protein
LCCLPDAARISKDRQSHIRLSGQMAVWDVHLQRQFGWLDEQQYNDALFKVQKAHVEAAEALMVVADVAPRHIRYELAREKAAAAAHRAPSAATLQSLPAMSTDTTGGRSRPGPKKQEPETADQLYSKAEGMVLRRMVAQREFRLHGPSLLSSLGRITKAWAGRPEASDGSLRELMQKYCQDEARPVQLLQYSKAPLPTKQGRAVWHLELVDMAAPSTEVRRTSRCKAVAR